MEFPFAKKTHMDEETAEWCRAHKYEIFPGLKAREEREALDRLRANGIEMVGYSYKTDSHETSIIIEFKLRAYDEDYTDLSRVIEGINEISN